MRSFHDEYNSRKACNDADPRATVRQRVHGIYLTAPLDAEAWAEVHTGLYADRSYVESSGEAAATTPAVFSSAPTTGFARSVNDYSRWPGPGASSRVRPWRRSRCS